MENIIKKYIIYLFLVVAAVGFALYVNVPLVGEYFTANSNIKNKKETVADLTKSLEIAKQNKIDALAVGLKDEKKIYEPEIKSTDAMVNFNGMLDTVLALTKQSGLKVKTVEFKSIPESDPIKQNHSNTHDCTLLVSQMFGTYSQLQNLLREIYKHDYLMGVNALKIVPYERDKKILIIDLSLSLYAKK